MRSWVFELKMFVILRKLFLLYWNWSEWFERTCPSEESSFIDFEFWTRSTEPFETRDVWSAFTQLIWSSRPLDILNMFSL